MWGTRHRHSDGLSAGSDASFPLAILTCSCKRLCPEFVSVGDKSLFHSLTVRSGWIHLFACTVSNLDRCCSLNENHFTMDWELILPAGFVSFALMGIAYGGL